MRSLWIAPLLAGALHSIGAAETSVAQLLRLHDFAPVSATNPVVARVKECGIEIPVSEFAAYIRTVGQIPWDPQSGKLKERPLTMAEKRRHLEQLIDEHLLLWDGCQQKADQTTEMVETMKATEAMLLREQFVQEHVNDKAKSGEEALRLGRKLRDQLFDKTDVVVSSEAFDELKAVVKRVKTVLEKSSAATNAAFRPPAVTLEDLSTEQRSRILARCKFGAIATEDLVATYLQQPDHERPDLTTQEGVTEILKIMLEEPLLIEEARRLQYEKSPKVIELMQMNRNTLARMYALDKLTAKTVQRTKEPDFEARLKEWYQSHLKTRYSYKDQEGKEKVVAFETDRESIENDYFDHLNELVRAEHIAGLRKGRTVEVVEDVLAKVNASLPVAAPTEMPPSIVAWDADIKDYTMQGAETNTSFSFKLTNVSDSPVTIYSVEPACECTTLKLPPMPWNLNPGEKGELHANVDLRGKTNTYSRTIRIDSSQGAKTLTMRILFPDKAKRAEK